MAAAALERLNVNGAPRQQPPVVVGMAQIQVNGDPEPRAQQRAPRGGRRQQNPFPARPPAGGQAAAVRNHERARANGNGGGGGARRRPAAQMNEDERQQAELQRFLELAQRDEEDGWDSDELGDDDGRFVIQ